MSKQIVEEVLYLTNQYRADAGLEPLVLNEQLNRAAQGHTEDMANLDFVSHTGRDGSTPSSRVNAEGYDYSWVAENWYAGPSQAERVVRGWMNSPGHRKNILNPNFKEIGIGYEYLANDTGSENLNHYWVQVFGTQQGGKVTPGELNFSADEKSEENSVETFDLGDEDLDFNLFGDVIADLPESDLSADDQLTGKSIGSSLAGDEVTVSLNTEGGSSIYEFDSIGFDYQNFLDLIEDFGISSSEFGLIDSELSVFNDFMVDLIPRSAANFSLFGS